MFISGYLVNSEILQKENWKFSSRKVSLNGSNSTTMLYSAFPLQRPTLRWMIALQHLAKVTQVTEFFLKFLVFLSNF